MATRRSRYEWCVGDRPSCNSTSAHVYSLSVYYDLFATVQCLESGRGIEFSVTHV